MTEFVEDTQQKWDDGYSLTDVEYADGNWVGIFGNDFGGSAYSIGDSLTEFKSDVAQRRGQGYDLVGVEYAEDAWVSVFAEDNRYSTKYAIAEDREEFQAKFEQRRDEGYDLIDFEQVDDLYLGIYEQLNPAVTEGLRLGSEIVISSILNDTVPSLSSIQSQ